MRVYIAGPYSKGDVAMNVRRAVETADVLHAMGHVPYIPHLTHFWHLLSPKPYEQWLEYDNKWIPQCDCLLRIPGESGGADKEMELAISIGIPVYLDIAEIPSA